MSKLSVWYHLPFEFTGGAMPDAKIWREAQAQPSFSQRSYFHRFVSDVLWEQGELTRYEGKCRDVKLRATRIYRSKKEGDRPEGTEEWSDEATTFHCTMPNMEMFLCAQTRSDAPRLGILVIELRLDQVEDGDAPRKSSLADVQNMLEWMRRSYPRWWNNDVPGDALYSLQIDGEKEPLIAPTKTQMEAATGGRSLVMPWISRLLKPFLDEKGQLSHFGDDRSYMTSAIALDTSHAPPGLVMNAVHRGDMMRLAEADKAAFPGDETKPYTPEAYQRPFLDDLWEEVSYNRHAYDPKTDTGNATQYLMTHHHLCMVGAGSYFESDIFPHAGEYYRHMQFLCIHELFRLLQFSQRLSRHVRDCADEGLARKVLLDIRRDFLRFTHLHHFSNVSSQLQPREMFDKLYAAMGIEKLFEEVAAELESATDFLAMQQAEEDAKAAEKRDKLIAIGVPAALAVGVAGMNIWVGVEAPDVPFLGRDGDGDGAGPLPFFTELYQSVVILVLVLAPSAWLARKFLDKKDADSWPLRHGLVWSFMLLLGLTMFAILNTPMGP